MQRRYADVIVPLVTQLSLGVALAPRLQGETIAQLSFVKLAEGAPLPPPFPPSWRDSPSVAAFGI